jgi:predicted helicase
LVGLARDWRQLLFPDADDVQFADAYAQVVTFALLLARSEGADPLTLQTAGVALAAEHSLLSRALQVLTDPKARAEISASVRLLVRVIAEVPQDALTAEDGKQDPWLFFYEDFLAAYDPRLRKDAGVYYTPREVVQAQVRLIDDLLRSWLAKDLGFADESVITLDPAAGTGTYLLGAIDCALGKVESQQGRGAVPGKATGLAERIYGFEIMVGPFAVTELRVSRALQNRGAVLPAAGTHVYLTDTLESPHAMPPQVPMFLKPIAEQQEKALEVKARVPVIVCLGNPPYDRHEAADPTNRARTGHWVRWGEDGKGTGAILKDFLAPAFEGGHGGHVKNLYNLYVYFWRWGLWKVFESRTAVGPGVVSYVSASSYLDGDAFCGMREHMRRVCDEVWVLDLGGEGRGARRSENVFAIQTPVAIAVAFRCG